jgi:serine/threonine protein phosphatase 1
MEKKKPVYEIYESDENNRYLLGDKGKNTLFIIGLNPSVATNEKSDKTMNRVKGFAKDFDSFIMLNLYPVVTPSPAELPANGEYDEVAFAKNLAEIKKIVPENATILAAWGNNIDYRSYLKKSFYEIYKQLEHKNCKWIKIGELTKRGNPRHPLYARNDWGLHEFDVKNKIEKLKF